MSDLETITPTEQAEQVLAQRAQEATVNVESHGDITGGQKPEADTKESQPQTAEQGKAEEAKAPEQTAETEEHQPEAEQSKEEPSPRRQTAKQRIDQLTQQRHQAEARARIAEQRLTELQKQVQHQPEIDDDDFEGQQAQRFRQVMQEDRAQTLHQERQEAIEARIEARNQTVLTALEAASDEMPGLVNNFMATPASDTAIEYLSRSENAAQIAHWLTSNPHDAQRIATMEPMAQVQELAMRDAQIRVSSSQSQNRISKAPPPTPTVTGASTVETKNPSDMTQAEYEAWRSGG